MYSPKQTPLPYSAARRAAGLAFIAAWPMAALVPVGTASALHAPFEVAAVDKRGIAPLDQLVLDARANGLSTTELTRSLAVQARTAPAALFEVLASNAVRVRVGERGRAAEILTPAERGAVIAAYSRIPLVSVRALLKERLAADPNERTRLAAMELIAAIGQLGDVDLLLHWAQIEGMEVRIPHAVRAGFGERLAEFMEREPATLRRVPALYARANLSLLPSFVSGLGAQPGPERTEALGELLGAVPRFDARVLAEIASLTKNARFAASTKLLQRVRGYLTSFDRALRAEAITIASQLGDGAAVPALIGCIDSRDQDLRRRALKALGSITGEQLEPTSETWRKWHADVTDFWMGDSGTYLERARNGNPGIASRAIQELSMLRIYRHELVSPLVKVLQREEVELVVLTSAALGHLGAIESVPHLVKQLESENVDIRRAAYHALRRLTGENHSDDPSAWREAGWGPIAR